MSKPTSEKPVVSYDGVAIINYWDRDHVFIVARMGAIFGHPILGNEEWVRTSYLVSCSKDGTIETKNTVYVSPTKRTPIFDDDLTWQNIESRISQMYNTMAEVGNVG